MPIHTSNTLTHTPTLNSPPVPPTLCSSSLTPDSFIFARSTVMTVTVRLLLDSCLATSSFMDIPSSFFSLLLSGHFLWRTVPLLFLPMLFLVCSFSHLYPLPCHSNTLFSKPSGNSSLTTPPHIFSQAISSLLQTSHNPYELVVHSFFPNSTSQPDSFPCSHLHCCTCLYLSNTIILTNAQNHLYHITNSFTCTSGSVIYYITCSFYLLCTLVKLDAAWLIGSQ